MPNRSSRPPRDVNQFAIFIVDQSTSDEPKQEHEKNPAAVALGRLGGLKGGKARAESMTPERRKEIAKKAAEVRWSNSNQQD